MKSWQANIVQSPQQDPLMPKPQLPSTLQTLKYACPAHGKTCVVCEKKKKDIQQTYFYETIH